MRDRSGTRRFRWFVSVGLFLLSACTSGTAPSTASTSTLASSATTSSRTSSATGEIDLSTLKGRIAFSGGTPHSEDVYVINADGTGRSRVTSDPAADFDPTWSPDGSRIAYRHQTGEDATTDIDVIEADGSGARNLTDNLSIADWGPAWSPNLKEIAWNSDGGTPGMFRGFLMHPDGSHVRPLGVDVWVEYQAWSPDGSKLAFMSQTPEGTDDYEIYVVNADGTNLRRLTHSQGPDGWPAWSPDGRRILFSSVRDDCTYSDDADCTTTRDIGPYHTLYLMNADGSQQTRVSDAFAQIADWSPDGRFIVFGSQAGLSIMRSDGSDLTTLPTGISESGFPDWIA
jgi:Tol biopolymer transport system component